MKKKKTLKKIIFLIIMLFLLWNIIWISNYYFIYKPFQDSVGKDEFGRGFMLQDDNRRLYSVHSPFYLSLNGNLSIADALENTDLKEEIIIKDSRISMCIWPSFLGIGDDEIEMIISIDKGKRETNPYNTEELIVIWEQYKLTLDENWNILKIDGYDNKDELYEETKEYVKSFCNDVHKIFGVGKNLE